MRVAPQHLQSFVPHDGGHLYGIHHLFEEPARGLVAEVVKGQLFPDL